MQPVGGDLPLEAGPPVSTANANETGGISPAVEASRKLGPLQDILNGALAQCRQAGNGGARARKISEVETKLQEFYSAAAGGQVCWGERGGVQDPDLPICRWWRK